MCVCVFLCRELVYVSGDIDPEAVLSVAGQFNRIPAIGGRAGAVSASPSPSTHWQPSEGEAALESLLFKSGRYPTLTGRVAAAPPPPLSAGPFAKELLRLQLGGHTEAVALAIAAGTGGRQAATLRQSLAACGGTRLHRQPLTHTGAAIVTQSPLSPA